MYVLDPILSKVLPIESVTMNTLGGFLLEPRSSDGPNGGRLGQGEDAHSGDAALLNGDSLSDGSGHDAIAIRKLSLKQEARLMDYLDEAFMKVNRAYQKRHNVATSSVPDVSSFLNAYEAILTIIASIPPIGPSASLLVQFLLRYTDEVLDGIAGYEVGGLDGSDQQRLQEELNAVVASLGLLDRVWSSVLRGQMVDLSSAKANVDRRSKEPDNLFPAASHSNSSTRVMTEKSRWEGQGGESREESDHHHLAAGRYPAAQASHHKRDSRSVIGSKGFATVGQTHRIRLRNLITLGKEALFTWMRIQLDVPVPPKVDADGDKGETGMVDDKDEAENGEANPAQDVVAVEIKKEERFEEGKADEDDEDEADLEEVDTSGPRDTNPQQDQEGDARFERLFARKIDPDASDSEDDNGRSSTNSGKRLLSPAPQASTKRRRRERDHGTADSDTAASRATLDGDDDVVDEEDDESLATLSGTARVMTWDLRFARLFALTLQSLSDIQEYSNNKRETSKDDARPETTET